MKKEKKGWKDLPIGLVLEAGTCKDFETGDWRSEKPVWHKEKCINCLICWISCPDTAIYVQDGKRGEFNFDHCKGCGICEKECPVKGKAISMEAEKK